ncbi:flagellar biosynthesis protein FlhB [Lysobacter olei]
MSDEQSQEDRTEQPTEKRLREAREKGQVPRSRELSNVAVLGAGTLALVFTGPMAARRAHDWMRGAFTFDPTLLDQPDRLLGHFGHLTLQLVVAVLPVLLVALLACFIAPAVMGTLRFSGQSLQPQFSRLNPMAGLKRMYGGEGLAELVRSLLRVALVGGAGTLAMLAVMPRLLRIPSMDLAAAAGVGVDAAFTILLWTVGAMGVLALADVPWQRFQHIKKLRMTKQELRDEFKQTEGNPEVKGRMRQVARAMAQRRMMEAVPSADVVVVNPTHYAVALKYDADKMRAPRVVAMGVDELALRIREVAGKHRITLVEAPPLARALYGQAKVDQEIPVNLYAAVAQVLTYVYQLRRWHPAHGPMPTLGPVAVEPTPAPPADGNPSR